MYPLMPLQIMVPIKRLRTLVALERPVLIHTAPTRPPTSPCPVTVPPRAAALRHPVGDRLAVPEVLGAARDQRHGRAGLVKVGHYGAVVRGGMVGVHVEGAGEGAGPGFSLGGLLMLGLLAGRAGAGLRGGGVEMRGWVEMLRWGSHAGEAAEGGEARAGVVAGTRAGAGAGAGELGARVGWVRRRDDGGGAVGG